MEDYLSPENIQIFWLFAMPGIILLYFRAQFLTGRMPAVAEGIVAYIVVSVVYHAVLFPIAQPFYGMPIETIYDGLLWFTYILAGPAIAGTVLGLSVQQGWGRRLLKKVKLRTVHSIASAWDWRFGNCPDCFVLAILKDGTNFAGYLGENSFVSSIPTERDIYIEKVYEIADDNTWVERNGGVWLAHGEIRSIEFWPN